MAVAALSLAASVPSALAQGRPFTPGEQQRDVDPSRPLALYPTGDGQNLAQTFTPRTNQRLGYLQLPVGCAEGVLLNVKIREGIDGAILYEANVAGLPVVVDGSFQLIQVYDPARGPRGIRLRKDRTYAFELAAFPGDKASGTTCGLASGPAGDSYSRGDGYYQDPINGSDFIPLGPGGEDLPFVTLVR
jgi:hypothetical protein